MEANLRAPLRVRPHQHLRTAQTVVEFALVSLVLFMLTFGIIEFGRAVMTRAMVTNAVREAVRVAVLDPNNTAAIFDAAAQRSPMLYLVSGNLTIACSTWGASATPTVPAVAPVTKTCIPVSAAEPNGYQPFDRVEVCIRYDFGLMVTGIIRSGTIQMNECGRGVIQ